MRSSRRDVSFVQRVVNLMTERFLEALNQTLTAGAARSWQPLEFL